MDDVINVSGHRIGTAEVESALVAFKECAEAAVVPIDHPIKGQAIYAFITLMGGHSYPASDEIRKGLVAQVGLGLGSGGRELGGWSVGRLGAPGPVSRPRVFQKDQTPRPRGGGDSCCDAGGWQLLWRARRRPATLRHPPTVPGSLGPFRASPLPSPSPTACGSPTHPPPPPS